jgi:hypothetical protein
MIEPLKTVTLWIGDFAGTLPNVNSIPTVSMDKSIFLIFISGLAEIYSCLRLRE